MMRHVLSVVLVLVCGSSTEAVIKVDIYYETLCGDSIRFIKDQLVPAYHGLKDYLDINFVPYGKVKYLQSRPGVLSINCQHGPLEYLGNKAHACALDQIRNLRGERTAKQSLAVNFVDCALGRRDPATAARQCAATLGLNSIDHCLTSEIGDNLLAACGYQTRCLNPPLSFVPTIVVDNVYSKANQIAALVDFKQLVRNYIAAKARRLVNTRLVGNHAYPFFY
ncbi:GILT-like protein 1 [Diachasma alloeum]|uniref:GILT-like protein 1 n=1 Tax=Diachasma alloeum TaxID=454923 RepID=UPI000738208B|nr:GILT-like protein 1 [Diachasma alloeum]